MCVWAEGRYVAMALHDVQINQLCLIICGLSDVFWRLFDVGLLMCHMGGQASVSQWILLVYPGFPLCCWGWLYMALGGVCIERLPGRTKGGA